MNLVETNQVYNKLIKRHELRAVVEYEQSPPTRKEVLQAIVSKLNVPESKVVILKMENMFGTRKMKIHAHIYDNEEDIRKFEREYILKRNEVSQ